MSTQTAILSTTTARQSKRSAAKQSEPVKEKKKAVPSNNISKVVAAVNLKKKKNVERRKPKSANATGGIRNVNFIKKWTEMENFRLSKSANEFLTKLMYREISELLRIGQESTLELKGTRVKGKVMNALTKIRLSKLLRQEYVPFADNYAQLLNGYNEAKYQANADSKE